MSESDRDARDERALDPGEKWGQGVDASHPGSATDQPIAEEPSDDQLDAPGVSDTATDAELRRRLRDG